MKSPSIIRAFRRLPVSAATRCGWRGEKYRRTYISGVNEDYMTINNYKVAKAAASSTPI